MSTVPYPIDINPYVLAAQAFLFTNLMDIPLTSAILDDWHSGEGKSGARIIYGFAQCQNDCPSCPLFLRVGKDNPEPKQGLHTSLCQTPERFKVLFARSHQHLSLQQTYLNCKSLTAYKEAFVMFLVECCPTIEMFEAELAWVMGFRLLALEGSRCPRELLVAEKTAKKWILEEAARRLVHKKDPLAKFIQDFLSAQNFT